jgi:hypothetical protein
MRNQALTSNGINTLPRLKEKSQRSFTILAPPEETILSFSVHSLLYYS